MRAVKLSLPEIGLVTAKPAKYFTVRVTSVWLSWVVPGANH